MSSAALANAECDRAQSDVAATIQAEKNLWAAYEISVITQKPLPQDTKDFRPIPIGDMVARLRRVCAAGTVMRLPADQGSMIAQLCDFSKSLYLVPQSPRASVYTMQFTLCAMREIE